MSAADSKINLSGSGCPSDLVSRTTAIIISKEEMEDIMKIDHLKNLDYQ